MYIPYGRQSISEEDIQAWVVYHLPFSFTIKR